MFVFQRSKLVCSLTLLLCVLFTSQLAADIISEPVSAIVDLELTHPSGVLGDKMTVGWSFTVNNSIQVTALGFFDMGLDGLGEQHLIGIWDENEDLLVQAGVSLGCDNHLKGRKFFIDC